MRRHSTGFCSRQATGARLPSLEAQDAADGVLLGRFGQAVAAGLAAQTGQVALPDKALYDGLQILFRKFSCRAAISFRGI